MTRSLLWSMLRQYSRLAPTGAGGYRLARFGRKFVPKSNWTGKFVAVDGIALDLDLAVYPDCCMALGIYELDTARLIRRILQPGMWFVDCGANIGYFTLLASKRVGPAGVVDAFEPDPKNLARLDANLQSNAWAANIFVHPLAVSDRQGRIEMIHPTASDANHGMSGAYEAFTGPGEKFTARAVRLDESLRGVPDLIKIDVEGAELAAIEGLAGILRTAKPPKIIIEHNSESAAAARFRPGDLFERVKAIQPRYRFNWIGWRRQVIRSAEKINRIHRQGNLLLEATR